MTDRRAIRAIGFGLGACLALAGCGADRAGTASAPGPGVNGVRYLAGGADAAGFARATEPRPFVFPADHGAHPDFRTEWWYFTGNVFDDKENPYGFELTIFRIALGAASPARESSLATNAVWMAHLTVTDTARRRFEAAERLSRGAPGLAGVTTGRAALIDAADASDVSDTTVIAVEDFSMTYHGNAVSLEASDADFGISLELSGLDRIVAQGNAGLDAKGPEPGNASYYFSSPRLQTRGTIRSVGAAPVAVEGTAWMDREWSTSALSPDIAGWDWFALQLDDGRDVMFYRLRGRDGSTSGFSGGSVADAAGNVTRLDADSVELVPIERWTSRNTGVVYPVAWHMTIPTEDLELEIRPRLDDQELDLSVRYWEGAITVDGRASGEPIAGFGYLELAGY
jgi:predicted secreted hydrolase